MSLNNLLFYQRQSPLSNKTKSTAAKAQADALFANPKSHKPEGVSESEIIKRQELEYDRAIQRQRAARLERTTVIPRPHNNENTVGHLNSSVLRQQSNRLLFHHHHELFLNKHCQQHSVRSNGWG
jgi:hypothetical protein